MIDNILLAAANEKENKSLLQFLSKPNNIIALLNNIAIEPTLTSEIPQGNSLLLNFLNFLFFNIILLLLSALECSLGLNSLFLIYF